VSQDAAPAGSPSAPRDAAPLPLSSRQHTLRVRMQRSCSSWRIGGVFWRQMIW